MCCVNVLFQCDEALQLLTFNQLSFSPCCGFFTNQSHLSYSLAFLKHGSILCTSYRPKGTERIRPIH